MRTSTSIRLSAQFFRDNEPTISLGVWACVVSPLVMQHAVLLGRDSWMRFNTRSYRALLPRPHDKRVFGELTLPHHAKTGVVACDIDPTATDGGFHLLYGGIVGVILSDEPQPLEVNFVRSHGSPALIGHYLVDMLPQPSILSMQEHFVSSGRQVLPLTGVGDLEPGDLVGVAHAPLLSVPLGALQYATHAAEPHPGQIANYQVSSVRSSPDTSETSSAVAPPSPALPERLNPDHRPSFLRVWARLPPHLREIAFDLHDPGWTLSLIHI